MSEICGAYFWGGLVSEFCSYKSFFWLSVPSWCSQQQMPLDDGWSRIIAASIWHIKEFQAADLKGHCCIYVYLSHVKVLHNFCECVM